MLSSTRLISDGRLTFPALSNPKISTLVSFLINRRAHNDENVTGGS
jgi:hypothetical protein